MMPYEASSCLLEIVFDRMHDRYLLVNVGWDNGQHVHGTLVHVDIIDGKLWIQRDGTEHGIAKELVRAGVQKDHIVGDLGYLLTRPWSNGTTGITLLPLERLEKVAAIVPLPRAHRVRSAGC